MATALGLTVAMRRWPIDEVAEDGEADAALERRRNRLRALSCAVIALVVAGLSSCVADLLTAVNVDSGVTPDTITEAGEPPDPVDEIDASVPQGAAPCRAPVLGTVVDVTDGDTIKVETGWGVERVRLIGIDTPEVDHLVPMTSVLVKNRRHMTAMLDGKRIWLTLTRSVRTGLVEPRLRASGYQ